jgi:hypothetical protein
LICLPAVKACEDESYDGPTTLERLQALHADMDQVLREADELRRAGRMYYTKHASLLSSTGSRAERGGGITRSSTDVVSRLKTTHASNAPAANPPGDRP